MTKADLTTARYGGLGSCGYPLPSGARRRSHTSLAGSRGTFWACIGTFIEETVQIGVTMDELRALVMAAQDGDQDAFGRLVIRFQDMAYAGAYTFLGDPFLAQDAA